ncbi:MAG: ABC transporter permease [Lachnospiraceae bacterium]|nr:ABC transporter permease [Lachnospiraceae bacterium]
MANNKSIAVKDSNAVVNYFKKNFGVILGLVILNVIFAVTTKNYFTASNILTMLQNNAVNAIICCGMLMAILMGQIDISVGSTVGLTGMVGAYLITNLHCNFFLALVISLLVGLIIGLINGFCIAYLKIPAFVATLATMSIGRGVCKIISKGISIRIRDDAYNAIAGTKIVIPGTEALSANGRVPLSVSVILIYAIILLALTWLLLNKTKFGYYIYAIGGNETAAKYSGIDTKLYNLLPYVITGGLCAVGGIIWASKLQGVQSTLGESFEMDAISAVVIGGTSMSGGSGTVGGTIIGILIIAVLSNGLNVMGVNSFWQDVFKGIIIIVAVVIDVLRKSKKR